MRNPIELFNTLESLADLLRVKASNAKTKAGRLAYEDSAQLLIDEIIRIKTEIVEEEEAELQRQMDKFDEDHSNYDVIFGRGHIGIPDDTHKHLSDFTLDKLGASEVFDRLPDGFKYNVLSKITSNKEMIEQLTAERHEFHYITHTKGHDGITPQGKVYEVKNRAYKKSKERFNPVIMFDRVSPANLRKLEEGRPEIIFNITDKHKVLVEMRIKFDDELIELYKKNVDKLKYSKTSGMGISFKDFKPHVIEITHVHDEIYDHHIHKSFLEFVRENAPKTN